MARRARYNKPLRAWFKECCRCKRYLPVDCFQSHLGHIDGFTSSCKWCLRKYNQQRREALKRTYNPEGE